MSDQEQNTGRTDGMDFSALDEELARMAEETPEVPEDFHDNWTKMIRKEAAVSSPETTNVKSRTGRGQLRYILSAAAAFVVLIGGVVLARNNGLLPGASTSVQEAPALMANTLAAGKTSEEAEAVYEDAAVPAEQTSFLGMSADSMPEPAPEAAKDPEEAAGRTAAAKANGVKAAQESVRAAPMPAATASPTEPALLMMDTGAAEMNADMDMTESEAAETAAEETETEEPAGEKPEESEEESAGEPVPETAEDGPGEDTRSFLQKAWEGTLDAVPWILGGTIIVLFILTYVVHPGKKK